MTREEEIIEASQKCNFTLPATLRSSFRDGAKWADANQPNPWRDAKNDPPKDSKSVIGIDKTGLVCHYEYSPEEGIWSIGRYISVAPDYWMPIPKTPKGGEI